MIYYHTPYATNGKIGEYYNQAVNICPSDDDWVCFTDRDVWFPHHHYGHIIEEYSKTTEYGLLTCKTNRVGPSYQNCNGAYWHEESNNKHVEIAESMYKEHGLKITDITDTIPYISGMLMMIKKSTWKKSGGFPVIGYPNNLFIDNDIHIAVKKCGERVGLMEGVYVWHYYRNGVPSDMEHLMNWNKFKA